MAARLGGWELLDVVGVGSHAVVHRAVHPDRPGRVVALKRLRDVDPTGVAALRREAEVLSGLAHPAIAVLHEVVVDDGEVALVLALATGGSLAQRLRRRGRLPACEVVDLGRRLAGALAAAHDVGVLHRDVSPANVLYGREDEPRLSDFGLAAALDIPPDEVAGTATYLDPDVAHGAPPGPASDTWGLAVVLWEALAGQPPWMGEDDQAVRRAADRGLHLPVGRLVHDAPDDLLAVLDRAIRRDPRERFRHPQQLELALAGVAAQTGPRPVVDIAPDRARPNGADDPAPGLDEDAVVAPAVVPSVRDGTGDTAPDADDADVDGRAGEKPRVTAVDLSASQPPPAGHGGTTVFGPRPPAPAPPPEPRRRSMPTRVLVAVALVVPVLAAVVVWSGTRPAATGARPAPPVDASVPRSPATSETATPSPTMSSRQTTPGASATSSPTSAATPTSRPSRSPASSTSDSPATASPGTAAPDATTALPRGWTVREPAPPCPGPAPSSGARVLAADVEGVGCSLDVVVAVGGADGGASTVLDVPADPPLGGRYVVADVADRVVLGDWDGDGVDTPAVVAADRGVVYTYDRWTAPGAGDVAAVPTGQEPITGEPAVATDPRGIDHVVDATAVR